MSNPLTRRRNTLPHSKTEPASRPDSPSTPGKFNAKTRELILVGIQNGMTYQNAAQLAGTTRMSLNRWLRRGEEEKAEGLESDYTRFLTDFRQAEGGYLGRVEMATGQAALQGDTRAAALILKARRPDVYRTGMEDATRNVVATLLEHLRHHLPANVMEQIVRAITSFEMPTAVPENVGDDEVGWNPEKPSG